MNALTLANWDFLSHTELDSILRLECPLDDQLIDKALGRRGLTPLGLACRHNREDLVTILLYHGADPNKCSNFLGKAPLHFACDHESDNIGVVKKLLEAKAEIDAVDEDGNTGLHLACTEENITVVKYLLANSADINTQDIDGESPLVRACLADNLELIELILKSGGEPNISDGQPLKAVITHNSQEALKLLLEAGADIHAGPFLSHACEQDNLDLMKILHHYGADVNKPNILGLTPLQTASVNDHASLTSLRLLLTWGADVNAHSGSQKTALHYACMTHNAFKIHILLDYGAEVNAYDFHRHSPLMTIIKSPVKNVTSWSESVHVVFNLLFAAGAEIRLNDLERLRSSVIHFHVMEEKAELLLQDLYAHASQPRSLQHLCRIHIRGVFNPTINDKLETLPLPQTVKRFLKLDDIMNDYINKKRLNSV